MTQKAYQEFMSWVDRNGTDPQWRSLSTAARSPIGLKNSNLRNRKIGHAHAPRKAKPMAFTLNETTSEWLNQMPTGTKSAVVEIALARYRLWYPLLTMVEELMEVIEDEGSSGV